MASLAAIAQELPKPLAEISEKGKFILNHKDLTDEQRKYLWAGTTRDKAGYLIVKAGPEYLRLVDSMVAHQRFHKQSADTSRAGIATLGTFDEGADRVTRVFTVDNSNAAVTIFDYRAAGARITIVDEFVNQQMLGSPASLALVISPGSGKGLWKLGIWTDSKVYEVYVPDKLDKNDRPTRSPRAVLTLAEDLVALADPGK